MSFDWNIKGRAEKCAITQRPFEEGEFFYTILFHNKDGFHRQDLCEDSWNQRNENIQPFSFWRSKFELPPQVAPEPLAKQTAEDLLRSYMQEQNSSHVNARYILALMLERKRILKQIEVKESTEGTLLIYEHVKTGEVFVVTDPQLHLDKIEMVQNEVAGLLGNQNSITETPVVSKV